MPRKRRPEDEQYKASRGFAVQRLLRRGWPLSELAEHYGLEVEVMRAMAQETGPSPELAFPSAEALRGLAREVPAWKRRLLAEEV